jgi:DNA-binding MarR family transcriptional regulator
MTNTQTEATTVTKTTADKALLPLVDHLARTARRSGEATLERGGLRPRHLVALRLLSEGGPTSQQTLAGSLSLDPSNVVGVLNDLEDRQLITRRRDPADRRRHIVALAPRGEDELSVAYGRLRLLEDDLFSALSAVERATLYDLLVRAVNGASPQCEVADGFGDGGTANGSDNLGRPSETR